MAKRSAKTKKKNIKQTLMQVLVFLLIIYCIFFPADSFNLKEILLLLTLICLYICCSKVRLNGYIVFFGFIFPAICIVYSVIRGTSVGSAVSFGYVWVFLLLIPAVIYSGIDVKTPFFFATYCVALIIDFIMLADLTGLISIFSNPIAVYLKGIEELQGLGKGEVATFGYSIFYKSCPLILVTYSIFLYKNKYLLCIPLALSMVACGTRANLFMMLAITVAIPVFCRKKSQKRTVIICLLIVAAIILMPKLISKMSALNEIKADRSDNIKINDMLISLDISTASFLNFVFGTGVGSAFTSSRGMQLSTFELAYVDYFRQVGLIGLILFAVFLMKPIKILAKTNRPLLVGYIAYLAVSFTNPLLVTSTSFMLYLLVYCEAFAGARKLKCLYRKKYPNRARVRRSLARKRRVNGNINTGYGACIEQSAQI